MTKARLEIEIDNSGAVTSARSLDDLSKAAAKAEKSTDDLGKTSKRASTEINTGFGQAASSVKTLVAGYIGFQAAKAALTSVISTTAEFGQSIANLSAITGATGKDLEYYSQQAKQIGRTTSLSASQAAEGFKLIASAKPDLLASAESLAAVTKEAVTLAEATGISLPTAAQALGSALNQFQLPATDANRVINALAASSQLGTAEVSAVTEAMRNAGSAANSLGLDFEETVAGIQALAASGRQGADAGTALRQVLLRLEATGSQNLQPSVVGLVGALEELKSMNLDNTELMDLFGQEAFTAATSLLAQTDVAAKLNETLRGTNTATEQAATNMNTLRGDFLEGKSAVEALMIALGEKLEPALRATTQATTGVISSWAEAVEKGRTLNEVLEDQLETMNKIASSRTNMYLLGLGGAISQNAAAQSEMNTMVEGFVGPFQQMTTLVEGFVGPLKQVTYEYKGFVGPLQQVTKNTEQANDKATEYIASLRREHEALGMTERAAAIFNAVTKAGIDLTAEQVAEVATLTAQNYDLEASTRATAEAEKQRQKDVERVNAEIARSKAESDRAIRESQQATHDYLSESLVDIMNNGGNAFDNIAKSFERMVQRMIAEWAASGLMSLFGIGGGSTAASVTGGLLGGLFGGGAKAAAGTVAGEIAAGGVGGLAATTGGGGIAGAIGAIPGWGWALAGGAALAAALGDKSTPSANAGMLIRDVPGASGRTFDVPAFDSGFKPVGFARREDQGRATEVINVFRADDAVLTALAKASGIDVSYSANQFGGFNEKGQGNGLFFGQASEDGRATSVSLDQQRDQFVKQWIYGLSGKVDPKLVQDVLAQGNADAMIRRAAQIAGIDGSYATGLDYVPFDNHRANLHTGERVLTNKDARAMDGIPALLSELIKLTATMMNDSRESKVYNRRAYEILDRWQGTGFPVTT